MNRVVRSTTVPIAELSRPMMRSRVQEPLGLGLGGPLADHDVGAYKLLAATTAASPRHAQRPPGAQAGRQLTAQCPPAPGCTALGKSPRARPSSSHRRDTRSGADGRSCGLHDVAQCRSWRCGHDVDHSRSPRLDQARASHPQPSPCRRGGPARPSDRSRLAWRIFGRLASGAVPLRSRRPIRQTASESPRCDAAHVRQSTGLSGADGHTHPGALSSQDRDLFPATDRSRSGRQADRRHTTATNDHPRSHATGHAASSLDSPRAIAFQNRCCSDRAGRARPTRPV